MTKKVDEKTDGVVIIDAVGTILMVNKVGGAGVPSTLRSQQWLY